MNWNVIWTFAAAALYWLLVGAVGTDWARNIVAFGGIAMAFANVLRYMPRAWEKYHTGASTGEWRMLMGFELFWLSFGTREAWLIGDRMSYWDATGSPLNGFFAFGILCAGLLCFSAINEPVPTAPHQNVYVVIGAALAGVLVGMIAYRLLWG